ncbi:MAG: SLBB domain-containing protein [Saprospiraceae bacterium]|nr:SLBB domain-containing protein [Saprospiraceae bacterium]
MVILAEEELSAIAYVEINGAVKRPGRYKFAKGMTSYDLITLALGYTYSASTKHIEIFRVIISDGNPTTTVVVNTETKRNLDDPNSGSLLEPFDIIVVEVNPNLHFRIW